MKTLLSLLLPLCLLAGGSMAAATCDVVTTDPDIPSEPAFYLLKDNENTTELCEGSTVHMCLAIHLPQGDTILNVEMFTPDNDTTLMVVCDPKVTSVGSNLAGVTTSFLPTLDAKDATTNYDHGVLNLGTVTNTGTDTSSATPSLLVVEWDAVMLKTSRSDVDGNVFWVSAGSEIINQTTNESSTIWVGQHSFVLNSSCNFDRQPSVKHQSKGAKHVGKGRGKLSHGNSLMNKIITSIRK